MCAARLDETVLINTQGNHRKAYRVWLELDVSSGMFHVGFAYGRIGQTLREGRKTERAVTQAHAAQLKSEIVREKEGRGYVQQRPVAPPAAPPPAKPMPKPRRVRPVSAPAKAAVEITVNRTNRQVVVF
jgi:predicted DNA-binding WGR domain protein